MVKRHTLLAHNSFPDLPAEVVAASDYDALAARLAEAEQYRHGHLPTCGGLNLDEMRCECGYLQGTAYRELKDRLAEAELERDDWHAKCVALFWRGHADDVTAGDIRAAAEKIKAILAETESEVGK